MTEHKPEFPKPTSAGLSVTVCRRIPSVATRRPRDLRNELEELRKTSETGAVAPPPEASAARSIAKNRAGWFVLATVVVLGCQSASIVLLAKDRPQQHVPRCRHVQRIVVLPFENLGPSRADAYFAAGMTDEITQPAGPLVAG